LHLRVGAARHPGGALVRLRPEAEADQADDGVGLPDLPPQHLLHGAVVRRKARLVLREAAFLLDFDFDGVTEGAELVGNAAQEDRGTSFHRATSHVAMWLRL